MNATEGLLRIASVVRWIGWIVSVPILVGAPVAAISESGDYKLKLLILFGFIVLGALVLACSATLAWIIEGFARPKSNGEK